MDDTTLYFFANESFVKNNSVIWIQRLFQQRSGIKEIGTDQSRNAT